MISQLSLLTIILLLPLYYSLGAILFLSLRVEQDALDRPTLQRELGFEPREETELSGSPTPFKTSVQQEGEGDMV
jgi:hypothetical protein